MPVGAFGGRRDIMEHIAPTGPVYQAGTLSGNPVAMAAGLKTLELIAEDGFFTALNNKVNTLVNGILEKAAAHDIPMTQNIVGGMFGLFFTEAEQVTNFEQATQCDLKRFQAFFHGMLEQGIYMAPSAYEAGFVSTMHSDEDIQATIDAADKVLGAL